MRRIIASAALALVSSVAFAADLPLKAPPAPPPPPPVFNWTGWYIGAHIGGYWGDTSNDQNLPNVSASNAFAGIQGGYRYQFPSNLVLGVQVSAPLWTSDESKTILPGVIDNARFKGSILGQGQLGLAMDRWLPFVTAGVGAVRVEGEEVIAGVSSATVANTHTMVTAGVGVNYAVTDHVTTGVRYNHLWTSHELYACGAFCTPPANIWFDADTVTGVLEYKF